jgi:hypothetical protein
MYARSVEAQTPTLLTHPSRQIPGDTLRIERGTVYLNHPMLVADVINLKTAQGARPC